jgi:S-DNA-T family DNA segregation ATPase FtsK/SpoIIIE
MFDQAVEVVLQAQRGSVSLLQRRLGIGYGRASRIIDQMAEAGLIGEHKGSQARECLITIEDWEAMKDSIAADQSGESSLNGEPTSA